MNLLDVKHTIHVGNFIFKLIKGKNGYYWLFGDCVFESCGMNFKTEMEAVDALEKHFGIQGQL